MTKTNDETEKQVEEQETESKKEPKQPLEEEKVLSDLHPKAVEFSSKDKLTCIALDALGHTPTKVERAEDTKASLFYYFPITAWEDWDKYRRGETLFVSIRDYEDAEKRFRNNLYDTK